MPERYLFEYAVIRVMPRVEREEFINAGVILYCPGKKFLKTLISLNEARLAALCPATDIDEVKEYLAAFHTVSEGGKQGGTIGALPIASRFRWLTAIRSSIVQASRVHPGMCCEPDEEVQKLFDQLVR
ncbi:DUF3037 domain-containing protein [Dyadobacter sandarakinus]|uniref:DUF3037 domain-containing protein n=2 Tax=Dyadobacter sandarakinus TaxID=2747268 RepID=A0ABX7IEY6_9BACT|nr:DUF3037 domain-containing protein [Dyadobacter sandarakinus]